MSIQDQSNLDPIDGASIVDARGFTTEDILWAVGIWSVILCLSPVVVFYLLMVA